MTSSWVCLSAVGFVSEVSDHHLLVALDGLNPLYLFLYVSDKLANNKLLCSGDESERVSVLAWTKHSL